MSSSSPSPRGHNNSNGNTTNHPAWSLQAQLWQNELTPTTPYKHHHIYNAKQLSSSAANNNSNQNNSSPSRQKNLQHEERTPSRALDAEEEETGSHEHLDISQPQIDQRKQKQSFHVDEDRAMALEAAAVMDEYSPDHGSTRSIRRRAEAIRSERHLLEQIQQGTDQNETQKPVSAASIFLSPNKKNSSFASSSSPSQQQQKYRSHGLESIVSPFRLHSIVSQKDIDKRKKLDKHAMSPTIHDRYRLSQSISDVDVAAYHGHEQYSFKLDKEADVTLSNTLTVARGGLSPEEKINKQVNRFVEKLLNAADREGDNTMLPPQNKAKHVVAFATPGFQRQYQLEQQERELVMSPKKNSQEYLLASAASSAHSHVNNTSMSQFGNNNSVMSPSSSSTVKRQGGLGKKLLEEQEHHIVGALASIILSKADPPSVEDLLAQQNHSVSRDSIFSFTLSPDDKHILLTALKFAVSNVLYENDLDFCRIVGFSKADGQKVLKALATTFDHWNRVCYDKGLEWMLLKRCLAAVTETPVNWAAKIQTSRFVHFGDVSQRDMDSLLSRLRNDEVNKMGGARKVVTERHRNRMV